MPTEQPPQWTPERVRDELPDVLYEYKRGEKITRGMAAVTGRRNVYATVRPRTYFGPGNVELELPVEAQGCEFGWAAVAYCLNNNKPVII